MDSQQKKLGSTMDGKTPHPLHVSVTVSATVAKKKTRAAIRRVSAWVLFTAFVFLVSYALGYATSHALDHYHVSCSQSSFFLRCDQLTDAEAAQDTALWTGMLCCAALQAAVAVLALQIPCRRRWVRRDLAYLALVVTIVDHCLYAADVHLNLAADPGDLFCWIFCTVGIFVCAAGDIISLLALLVGGEEWD